MRKTRSLPSIAKQSGNAAILFALLIPVLFVIFVLASDGARALQSKARLDDALEAASLAVSAANVDTDAQRTDIAKDYISQYMTDMASGAQISAVSRPNVSAGDSPSSISYIVTATTKHTSWFPGTDAIQGFGDTFSVSGSSVARKYQSEAVDVVFAADFSGSMRNNWEGGSQAKYLDLINIIHDVTDTLDNYNRNSERKSTAAFVPFDDHTVETVTYHDRKVGDGIIGEYNKWKYTNQLIGREVKIGNRKLPTFIINYDETIKQLFSKKEEKTWIQHKGGITKYFNHQGKFYTLPLTSNFYQFNTTIDKFSPGEATASYQGIIRSAQAAKKGKNAQRLIIVITDGNDTKRGLFDWLMVIPNEAEITKNLVAKGMCDKIRETLNKDTNDETPKVTTTIAVIGFNYDPKKSPGLSECAGAKNVYNADNREEIKNKILALISEEIGRLS